jgi:guanylate kinase
VIEHRLALADRELAAIRFFDYAIVNDDFEQAVESVLEIVAAEREGRGEALLPRYGREAVLATWPHV